MDNKYIFIIKMPHVLIIGAGPAGLYAAGEQNPSDRVTIIEKAASPGGRTRMVDYKHHLVPGGAGVVRETDVHLRALCARYGIPLTFRTAATAPCYRGFKPRRDILRLVKKFSRIPLTPEARSKTTFGDFLTQQLPDPTERQAFLDTVGYTDYLSADVTDTLHHYGWRDVVPRGTRMSRIDWNHLMECMAAGKTIHYSTEAVSIDRRDDGSWRVATRDSVIEADTLILAIPSVAIVRLLRKSRFAGCRLLAREIDDQVQMQPFLRVYATLPDDAPQSMSQITSSPLQKSFPMFDKVWMISYSDNAHALTVRKASSQTMARWFGTREVKNIRRVFYRHGTHYFKPLSLRYASRDAFLAYIRHPMDGLYITGEGFSNNQGWTEGALES